MTSQLDQPDAQVARFAANIFEHCGFSLWFPGRFRPAWNTFLYLSILPR